jgi:hypothetical protein
LREVQGVYKQRVLIINEKKSEYIIFGNNKKGDISLQDYYISVIGKGK